MFDCFAIVLLVFVQPADVPGLVQVPSRGYMIFVYAGVLFDARREGWMLHQPLQINFEPATSEVAKLAGNPMFDRTSKCRSFSTQ